MRRVEEWFMVGLKFTSTNFSANAEIVAIRKDKNEVDVLLIPSDGNAWIEKNWNYQHVLWGFERNEYIITEPNPVTISVY